MLNAFKMPNIVDVIAKKEGSLDSNFIVTDLVGIKFKKKILFMTLNAPTCHVFLFPSLCFFLTLSDIKTNS
jgi:hypothetical protein